MVHEKGTISMALIQHPTNKITETIIGAAIEVHRTVGPGLLESTYERCLSRELQLRGLPHACQVVLPLEYKGIDLEKAYVVDLLVDDTVVVELKAKEKLLSVHEAQVLTYLRLSKRTAGLLINFNVKLLHEGIRRLLS
jgi:GxxExxY protein